MKVESLRPTRDLKPETNLGPERLGSCFLDAAGAPQGAGDIEHVAEHLGMDLRPLDVSPAHGDLGSLQHALEIVLLVGAVASPDKARHDFRQHAATKRLHPVPIVLPEFRRTPIPSFTWSPTRAPSFVSPVSSCLSCSSIRMEP